MDKDDFTQYSMYLLKLADVCAYLSNDIFRLQVRCFFFSLFIIIYILFSVQRITIQKF